MPIKDVLAKLTLDDKKEILRHIVILPMIEDDKSLSQEELEDIKASGHKLGFDSNAIMSEVETLVKQIGAVIEKE